ncbi:MAG: prolipoprotein diacylglyceryl transferase [Spirochaetes bacterium]|nr:prolipoprotein diacylglyceryl transferase [Spirochaetota bacterium]
MNKKQALRLFPLGIILTSLALLLIITLQYKGFKHNINPMIINLGILEIRFYGLVYFSGFLAMYIILLRKIKKGTIPVTPEDSEMLIMFLIIGLILGARIFEVIFYNPSYFLSQPVRILRIWEGGLSFHGALTGVVIVCMIYSRRKKIPFYDLTDTMVMPGIFFIALGRFANFTNAELYGVITAVPWGVKFKEVEGFRHPVQIYETYKNLIIFGTLFFMNSFKLQKGTLSWLFMLMYGIFRFVIEFWKDPSYSPFLILGLKMGQVLSLVMVILSLIYFGKKLKNTTNLYYSD